MSTAGEQLEQLNELTEEQQEAVKDITVEAMQLLGQQVNVATDVVSLVADLMEDPAVAEEVSDELKGELAGKIAMFALLDIAVARQRERVANVVSEFGIVV